MRIPSENLQWHTICTQKHEELVVFGKDFLITQPYFRFTIPAAN